MELGSEITWRSGGAWRRSGSPALCRAATFSNLAARNQPKSLRGRQLRWGERFFGATQLSHCLVSGRAKFRWVPRPPIQRAHPPRCLTDCPRPRPLGRPPS
eukprot:2968303-Pyramimonas_sp.AAC.1